MISTRIVTRYQVRRIIYAPVTTIRLDFDCTVVRLLTKGHFGDSDITLPGDPPAAVTVTY